jgi:hypothetical protein
MTEDPIRNYSKANDELDKAIARVQKLQMIISDVGRELNRKPYDFAVSNIGVGFPAEVSLNPNAFSLNANEWPTAKVVAEALSDLHKKRDAVQNAWYALSDADKKLVKKPDFLAR